MDPAGEVGFLKFSLDKKGKFSDIFKNNYKFRRSNQGFF
jgi:hypothetical protein